MNLHYSDHAVEADVVGTASVPFLFLSSSACSSGNSARENFKR